MVGQDAEPLSDTLSRLEQALDEGNIAQIADVLMPLHPSEQAELIQFLDVRRRMHLAPIFQAQLKGETLALVDVAIRQEMLSAMEPANIAHMIQEMESDVGLVILEDVAEARRADVFEHLTPGEQEVLQQLLTWPEDSAGRLMQRECLMFREHWTVSQTLRHIAEEDRALPKHFYDLFIVDKQNRVVGAASLRTLITSHRNETLHVIMDKQVQVVPAGMDQEEVVLFFKKYDIVSAPVVNANRRLIGMITIDDVVDVMDQEAEQDMLQMSGLGGHSDFHETILSTSFSRMRWLCVTCANTLLGAVVIAQFEDTLQRQVAFAILMPVVCSMGGNSGMQVVTVAIRALATKELTDLNQNRMVVKELIVNLINGLLFSAFLTASAIFWYQDLSQGLILGIATLLNMVWAALFGILFPLFLNRYGWDPAPSAAPILSTCTDIMGYLLFLGLAARFYT